MSERRFYQKITDIYATSIDYDSKAQTTRLFFAKVQNQLHWAIHGETAAEVIYHRADSEKEHMGLQTFPMTMEDWAEQFEGILRLSKKEVLMHAGSISAKIAEEHALSEFEKYRIKQDRLYQSDFDRVLLEMENEGSDNFENS